MQKLYSCTDMRFLTSLYCIHYNYDYNYFSGSAVGYPSYSLAFIRMGSCDFITAGRVIHAYAGDMVFIPPGTIYKSYWKINPQIDFYTISFLFNPLATQVFSYTLTVLPACERERDFEGIIKSMDKGNFLVAQAQLLLLFDAIRLQLHRSDTSHIDNRICKAMLYLEENCTLNTCTRHLADMCYLSEPRFYVLFKEATGCTPVEYKNRLKMRHAVTQLMQTDKTIEQISEELGFGSPYYFRTTCKKLLGKTPKEIRNNPRSL